MSSARAGNCRIYDLARCLARPVSRGWMSHGVADAVLLINAIRCDREGEIDGDPIGAAGVAQGVLKYCLFMEANR